MNNLTQKQLASPLELKLIDSHTGGEPTRTIISGAPDLGMGQMSERLLVLQTEHDHIRRAIMNEPRGSDVIVGALLQEPVNPDNAAGVIFFNNVGYLGMCGHGTIGVAVTLYHLGKIGLGEHVLETPVGEVTINMLTPSCVQIENVASYRYAQDISIDIPEFGKVTGDIAWGGNWFYLVKSPQQSIELDNVEHLIHFSWQVRQALEANGITGKNGALIDHVELFGAPANSTEADSKNFVLCPGKAYDRSPCGTGTSAKMACLYADGKLQPNQIWLQQSIIGSIFQGQISLVNEQLIPQITGEAFVNQEISVIFNSEDPFQYGFS